MIAPKPIFIVHVIHHLMIGGMENGVVNLINRLPADRFRHAVVCIEDFSDFSQRIERRDVDVHALNRSKIGVMRMRWRLFKLLRRLRPDIVHSRNLSGLDALLPARLVGAATLHSEHGFDVEDLSGKGKKNALLRRLHAPLVRRYVTVSKDIRKLLVNDLGICPERITQIYNGVDTDKFIPVMPKRHGLLPEPMQGDNLFVIGTVGRLRPIKDQATLLRAVAAVLTRNPHWTSRLRLVLVGDGPLLPVLKQLADQLGITAMVWFTGARNDVMDLLQLMDLFVLPSLNEGISNTLLEAMATGIPVLATAVGGNPELLDAGVVGHCFISGDFHSLARMIESYADNPALCTSHGGAARQRVLQRFSLPSMLRQYQAVYQAL